MPYQVISNWLNVTLVAPIKLIRIQSVGMIWPTSVGMVRTVMRELNPVQKARKEAKFYLRKLEKEQEQLAMQLGFAATANISEIKLEKQVMVLVRILQKLSDDNSMDMITKEQALEILEELGNKSYIKLTKETRPSAVVRWWPSVLLLAYSSKAWPTAGKWLHELHIVVQQFTLDWVVEPIERIYATIRHRERQLVVAAAQSLSTDLESLQRMVEAYTGIENVSEQVRHGDLSIIMKDYEQEIKRPIRSALFGPLVQLLLIQVQKTKVDVGLAMTSLDKLLQQNELNFAFLALVPAFALFWGVWHWKTQWKRNYQPLLRQMERTLGSNLTQHGQLLLLAASLHGYTLPSEAMEDLIIIENWSMPVKQRRQALKRLYRILL